MVWRLYSARNLMIWAYNMTVVIRKASPQEWDYMVEQDTCALFSQSRIWFEIWGRYLHNNHEARFIEFEDGVKILLPLAFDIDFRGLVKNYVSSPNGIGGYVSTTDLGEKHKRCLDKIILSIKPLLLNDNPFRKSSLLDVSTISNDFTQAINLTIGFDAILKKWTKGHYSAAKKAMKSGLVIRNASGIDEWREYFTVYQDSILRWGDKTTSNYRWELFEDFYCNNKDDKIRLWIATYDDKIVSGALCFYHNKHISYWHSAGLKDYFHLNAGHLLQYEIISDACSKGFTWYDFNSSGGHESVVKFKSGFGAERIFRNQLINKSYLNGILTKIRSVIG